MWMLLVLGCATTEGPTYYADAKPIVDEKCATCHQPDGIGPFPLTSYAEIAPLADVITASIESGDMPPWQPDDACREYTHSYDLSDDERTTLLTWLEAGLVEGDPATSTSAGPPVREVPADFILTLPDAYTPTNAPDDYRCQLIDWPVDEPTYVTGFHVQPDQQAIVHHVLAFVIPPDEVSRYEAWDEEDAAPGYPCFGGPTSSNAPSTAELLEGLSLAEIAQAFESGEISLGASTLGAWVPGKPVQPLPDGTGLLVRPGSKIVIQMHYNMLSTDPVEDRTSFAVTTSDSVEKPAVSMFLTDIGWVTEVAALGESMLIPAGDPEVTHTTHIDLNSRYMDEVREALGLEEGAPLLMHSATHHMHELGTSGSIVIEKKDGSETCALEIPKWDFNWQSSYAFEEPIPLEDGDRIRVSCTWDNSAANQVVVDGVPREPQDVTWGEGTTDEMCLGNGLFSGL